MNVDKNINSKMYIENLVVIANFIELGSKTVTKIAGNDISTKVDSNDINLAIRSLIAGSLNLKLSHYS